MAWTILGKNDEVTTCECCGKSGLKLTIIMTDGGTEVRYGRDCAARAIAPIYRNGCIVGSSLTTTKIERMADNAHADGLRRPRFGVVKISTGMIVVRCITREEADNAVSLRGEGYAVCPI